MNAFLAGAYMMACAAVALFFVGYWRETKDRLFAILALAFGMLAVERTVLALLPVTAEGQHWIFLARFFAFTLILAGIIDKNRPRRTATE